MDEKRNERGPAKIADLDRLREELDQLGHAIGRSAKNARDASEQEEPQTMTIRGR